jgi:hypothetical protein
MSEYQFYEFQTINRPLTANEMDDRAVKLFVDLRDLAVRGQGANFELRIKALRQAQARKPSFIERLRKTGL